jgi:hypothetical protein
MNYLYWLSALVWFTAVHFMHLGEKQAVGGAMIIVILALIEGLFLAKQPHKFRYYVWLATAALLGNALVLLVDLRQDPTSHNIWPLEMIFSYLCAWIGLTMVYFILKIINKRRS